MKKVVWKIVWRKYSLESKEIKEIMLHVHVFKSIGIYKKKNNGEIWALEKHLNIYDLCLNIPPHQ